MSGGSFSIFGIHTTEFTLTLYAILAFLLVFTLGRIAISRFHINLLPESALIIVIGVIFGAVAFWVVGGDEELFEFDTEIFFLILIPVIIFEAGFASEKNFFFRNIGTILLFALVGTLLNTLLTATLLYTTRSWYKAHFTLYEALAFGALISAVDPVAVLSIFDEIAVNKTLNVIVFGESLLNDAVSIVLYQLFISLEHLDDDQKNIIGLLAVGKFFYVSFGGIAIGALVTILFIFFTKYTKDVPLLEPLLGGLAGYLAFLIAETLQTSGIMAVLFGGMILSRYFQTNVTHSSAVVFDSGIKLFASTSETLTFGLLGMTFVGFLEHGNPFNDGPMWDFPLIAVTIGACIVFRFLLVFGLSALANLRRMEPIPLRDQFVMSYGGLRGAIAFALAFSLPLSESKGSIVTTTLMVVLFTVFVQGSTMKLFIKLFDVRTRKRETLVHSFASRVIGKVGPYIHEAGTIVTGHYQLDYGWRSFLHHVDSVIQKIILRRLVNEERELLQVMMDIKFAEEKSDILTKEDKRSLKHLKTVANVLLKNRKVNKQRVAAECEAQVTRPRTAEQKGAAAWRSMSLTYMAASRLKKSVMHRALSDAGPSGKAADKAGVSSPESVGVELGSPDETQMDVVEIAPEIPSDFDASNQNIDEKLNLDQKMTRSKSLARRDFAQGLPSHANLAAAMAVQRSALRFGMKHRQAVVRQGKAPRSPEGASRKLGGGDK